MNEHLIRSMGLAFLSYDEKRITDHVDFLFRETCQPWAAPHYEQHWIKGPNGKYFFGIVVDWNTQTAFLPCRGTDGDNAIGNLQSWITNATIKTGENDIHDGFEHEGNMWFEEFDRMLPRVKSIVTSGQSQGASVQQYMAKLCYENLSSEKIIFSHGWAIPPWCRRETDEIIKRYQATNRLLMESYYHEYDPVCHEKLYKIAGAKRVGNWICPADPIGYDLNLGNVVTHSCRLYAISMLRYGIRMSLFDQHGIAVINEIIDRCVN
jgi:hypothetical protein